MLSNPPQPRNMTQSQNKHNIYNQISRCYMCKKHFNGSKAFTISSMKNKHIIFVQNMFSKQNI